MYLGTTSILGEFDAVNSWVTETCKCSARLTNGERCFCIPRSRSKLESQDSGGKTGEPPKAARPGHNRLLRDRLRALQPAKRAFDQRLQLLVVLRVIADCRGCRCRTAAVSQLLSFTHAFRSEEGR